MDVGNFDIIKEYELLCKSKPLDSEAIFKKMLLKANIEWDLNELLLCRENTITSIENITLDSKTFPLLLKVSVLIGEFDLLFNKIGLKCLDIDDSDILNTIFKKYYRAVTLNEAFNISNLFEKCTTCEEKSIVLYLISKLNNKDKKDFLNASFIECSRNISVIRELYKIGYKLEVKSLNDLYKLNPELFYLNDYKNTESDEKFNMLFKPLGGGDSIGASSYLINIDDIKLLVDCGIRFENNDIILPNYDEHIEEIKSCELCIITHAHLDHCGAILKLYELNNSILFIMNKETMDLLKINLEGMLTDTNRYMFDDLLKRILILKFNKPFQWRKSDLTIELYRAGHILGASSVFLKTSHCNIFITGDYCIDDQKTVKGLEVPINQKVDILITENTYGNKKLTDINSKYYIYEKFKSFILDKIKQGKKIMIPAFAIGRSQELISVLKDIANKNNFRIYVDGASIKATNLYSTYGLNLSGREIHHVKSDIYESKEDFIFQEFLNNKSCVITSSGMLQEGSTSATYAKCLLGNSDVVCILTGYQAGNTIGARLREQFSLDADRYIVIDDEKINILCEFNEFHLSAHCSNTEIMSLINYLVPKKVILVHGEVEENKKSEINKILENNKNIEVIQSRNNISVEL